MIDLLIANVKEQRLECFSQQRKTVSYVISTATNGVGELESSFKTPRGWHQIAAKIGENATKMAVFESRKWKGQVYTPQLGKQFCDKDWILSRILRLSGLTSGFNRGFNSKGQCIDTWQRYIYIHGTADETTLGKLGSHGCIRMANDDIIELFQKVALMAKVLIL